MSVYIVVENPGDWPLEAPGADVIPAREYLTNPAYANLPSAKVFNLCRSYRYQSMGYYVSLLAAARGHKSLPAVSTLVDLKLSALIRIAADELQDLIQKSLQPLQSDEFTLSIYFGKNVAHRYDRLSARIFRLFPAPLIRCHFIRDPEEGWQLKQLLPIPASEIPEAHHEYVVDFARDFFERRNIPSVQEMTGGRFSLAILVNEEEADPPSDEKALARFERAAQRHDFSVERITREDYGHLAEFDALFIRETTNVNHHTFRFARRAQAEGLVVMDDPDSILRCSNKVFLAELMQRAKVPMPRTVIVNRDNVNDAANAVGFPCILKQPDSAFSKGVLKVENQAEFEREAKRLLEKSELVIVQEFLPTDFDWRIGIINREPLYVCKYHMAKKHWQIVKREDGKEETWGKAENVPLWQVPRPVVQTALKVANLIGDGLYGVDLKQAGNQCYIMEINDNPDINAGTEDAELKDELYNRVMQVFLERVEKMKQGKARK